MYFTYIHTNTIQKEVLLGFLAVLFKKQYCFLCLHFQFRIDSQNLLPNKPVKYACVESWLHTLYLKLGYLAILVLLFFV